MTQSQPRKRRSQGRSSPAQRPPKERDGGPIWLWGSHAVLAALANSRRVRHRLLATANAARRLDLVDAVEITPKDLDRLLPAGAVHQGVAFQTDQLEPIALDDLMDRAPPRLAVLDQLADPHNLGAIFRSAAAFDVAALILQTRHTPAISGIVAKSAAGAVETVAECRVVNIARTLETLSAQGYSVVGLAGEAQVSLKDALDGGPAAIVLGAEGAGLRPGVAKACTHLAKIAISPRMESLNVSNAAAIAFYEIAGNRNS
ncbi:MAG: RNA methyltransferase [Pseudomonadota bacterium]